jgi:hypothetical protein
VGCALLAAGYLLWRVGLPNNGHRDLDLSVLPVEGEMAGMTTNGFDDVVTIVSARNFAKDGFLRTHLLPNRRGAPLVSYFDFSRTQCESLSPVAQAPVYPGFTGEPIPMVSLGDECIYTHYPPLADWVFGGMAALGFDQVVHYKRLAVLLNAGLLLAMFFWLCREVHPAAALTSVVFTASAPAFFEWGGALYYQPFQYLFLVAGLTAWAIFLERGGRTWFTLTWLLFVAESLVSYELIAFFAIGLAGTSLLDRSPLPRRLRLLGLQATAPLLATVVHFSLRISLFGLSQTWANARVTVRTRMLEGIEAERVSRWFDRVHYKLLPLALMALALSLVIVVRRASGADLRRPLGLLAALLLGAASFTCMFPGMAVMHTWMMYRHLLPFTVALVALLADALGRATRLALPSSADPSRARRLAAAALAVLCGLPLVWAAARSARALVADAGWHAAANRHHDPSDLSTSFLDALYWKEGPTQSYGVRILTPLDGHRVDSEAHPSAFFSIDSDAPSHYEIWWLAPISIARVSFLTEDALGSELASHCRLSVLDGRTFVPARSSAAHPELVPFRPGPGEALSRPLRWVQFSASALTRALRLSCTPRVKLPIHHVEVL